MVMDLNPLSLWNKVIFSTKLKSTADNAWYNLLPEITTNKITKKKKTIINVND